MKRSQIPLNESERLEALNRYKVLDTLPEQEYDDLTQLAADICGTPIALISLVDRDRQWFKSRVGLDVSETPRDISFCTHVVTDREILNIPDTTKDDRFADNPLVVQDPNIRLYVGVPLITPDLYVLGTLCVIDRQPRNLTPKQIQQLQALGRLAISQLELRLSSEALVKRTANLKARVEREQLISMIATKIAASLYLPEILEASVQKLRSLLGCDRMLIWEFQPDGSGLVIYESVGADWRAALNDTINDPNFRWDVALRHEDGHAIAKETIFTAGYTDSYLQWLGAYQVKSNLVVPLRVSGQLWGLLDGHQCASYRVWQNTDLVLMDEITMQIAIAIQQSTAMVERQRAEVALRDSKQRFASLAAAAPVGIFRTDAEGNCLYVNDRWCQISGLTPSEAGGFGWVNGIHLSDRELAATEWNASVQANRPFSLEYRFQNTAGQITWVYGQAVAECDEFGEIIGYVGTITDISNRKHAEAALQQLNQDLEGKVEERTQELWQVNSMQRAILDGADYAFISTDLNGIIQTFNATAERMLGYSASEVIGKVTPAIIHDRQEVIDRAASLSVEMERDITVGFEVFVAKSRLGVVSEEEWTYIRKDGSRFPVMLSVTSLKDFNEQIIGFLGIAQDISDRKQAEESLRNLSNRLTLAVKSAQIGIWDWDVTHNILTWDDRMYELYGIMPNRFDIIYDVWARSLHKDDRSITETAIKQALSGEKDYDPEFRVVRPDGTICFIKGYALVQRNAQGEPQRMVGVNFDISDRKQAEVTIQQTTAQLAASNRELEAFAYSVSHDLRSPLRAIDGFSMALLEDYGEQFDAEGKEYFARIRHNIQRMGMLIDDLLRLSRVSRSEMQYSDVNLSTLVQEQVDELQVSEPERQVEVVIAPDVVVVADVTLMRVVISNLVQNAWKFTSHHATSRIEFGTIQQEEQLTYFVRDNGAGFDMAYAKMLFGVFQRLHNTNEFPGTGIGLATVQRSIHRHGGRVWAEGAVEQGATIYFTVPNISMPNISMPNTTINTGA